MQNNLFTNQIDPDDFEEFDLGGIPIRLFHSRVPAALRQSLLQQLIAETPWRQDQITIAGRTLPVPRLQCWMGEPGVRYRYSGIRLEPQAWSAPVLRLREFAESATELSFNSVLINYYRDGRDSVAWHADNEPELGPRPVIASISLGAERPFDLRNPGSGQRQQLLLPDGSLLVMGAGLQVRWQHQVRKIKGLQEPRVSLTFRQIMLS